MQDLNAKQARRVIKIYQMFLNSISLNVSEIMDKLIDEFPDLKLRALQRDLKVLADEGFIEFSRKGRYSRWHLIKNVEDFSEKTIDFDEMLAFYTLKAYLKSFKNTGIERHLKELEDRLELLAPGDVFFESEPFMDNTIGNYDYSEKDLIITELFRHIYQKNWVIIRYLHSDGEKINEREIFPQSIYYYGGSMYLIAYTQKHRKFFSLAVQNILSVSDSYIEHQRNPGFYAEKFQESRFAVYDGAIEDVVLEIKPEFRKYFENRHWHKSQKVSIDKSGNMLLKMKVPAAPDLIGWICSWGSGIKVLQPESLKKKVIKYLKQSIENYN